MNQNNKIPLWLETLENMAIRAFESRKQDRLWIASCSGLTPGEPVDGGQLQREHLDLDSVDVAA